MAGVRLHFSSSAKVARFVAERNVGDLEIQTNWVARVKPWLDVLYTKVTPRHVFSTTMTVAAVSFYRVVVEQVLHQTV